MKAHLTLQLSGLTIGAFSGIFWMVSGRQSVLIMVCGVILVMSGSFLSGGKTRSGD
jgi:hypothetical protein